MKKIYLITIVFLFVIVTLPVLAEDIDLGDYSNGADNAWYGQKKITDEEFEKTMKQIEEKKNKQKNKKKKQIKGQSLYKNDEFSNEFKDISGDTNLLSLPVNLVTVEQTEIPVGHYDVVGKKIKNKVYLEFRQSHSLVATVEAFETKNDFGEAGINFVKVLPYDESCVKLIFGSLDFNAYTILPVKTSL